MKFHALAQLALMANFAFGQQLRQRSNDATGSVAVLPSPEASAPTAGITTETKADEMTSFIHALPSAAGSRILKKKKATKAKNGTKSSSKNSKASKSEDAASSSTPSPSFSPSNTPSFAPSQSNSPSNAPSLSVLPSNTPSFAPSDIPSISPSVSMMPTSRITLSLLNTPGECAGAELLSCRSSSSTINRDNTWINCFDIRQYGASPPFYLESINFWMSRAVANTLEVIVYEGTEITGTSGVLIDNVLYQQALSSYTADKNIHTLTSPVEVTTNTVCVGIFSPETNLGFPHVRNQGGSGTESYILAPFCAVTTPRSIESFGVSLNFCIEADVVFSR